MKFLIYLCSFFAFFIFVAAENLPASQPTKKDMLSINMLNVTQPERALGDSTKKVVEPYSKKGFISLMSSLGLWGIAFSIGKAVSSLGQSMGTVLVSISVVAGILYLTSLVFAIISAVRLAKHPEKYIDKGLSTATLLLHALVLALPTAGLSLVAAIVYMVITDNKKKQKSSNVPKK